MYDTDILISRFYNGETITIEDAFNSGILHPVQRIYEIKSRCVPVVSTRDGRRKLYRIDPAVLPQIKRDVMLFQLHGRKAFTDLPVERYISARYIARALSRNMNEA